MVPAEFAAGQLGWAARVSCPAYCPLPQVVDAGHALLLLLLSRQCANFRVAWYSLRGPDASADAGTTMPDNCLHVSAPSELFIP